MKYLLTILINFLIFTSAFAEEYKDYDIVPDNVYTNCPLSEINDIAKEAFYSRHTFLIDTATNLFTGKFESIAVLFPNYSEIKIGNFHSSDPEYIISKKVNLKTIQKKDRQFYILQNEKQARYWILRHKEFNWKHDWYTIYDINNLSIEEALQIIESNSSDIETEKNINIKLLNKFDYAVQPWVIYLNNNFATITQYSFFPQDWEIQILSTVNSNEDKICSIHFLKPNIKKLKNLKLINECLSEIFSERNNLMELAIILDQIIGIPNGWKGTFDPIGKIRGKVCIIWYNVLFRPWVFEGNDPFTYNTLVQVHEGLKEYGKTKLGRSNYQKLQKLYSLAEKDLAKYYEKKFNKSKQDAAKVAKKALETTLRYHFVFPKEK